jgi:hypothetical protein
VSDSVTEGVGYGFHPAPGAHAATASIAAPGKRRIALIFIARPLVVESADPLAGPVHKPRCYPASAALLPRSPAGTGIVDGENDPGDTDPNPPPIPLLRGLAFDATPIERHARDRPARPMGIIDS